MKMKNKIAIIILTFNSEKIIKRTIKAAQKISKEIVILDSFSTDKTIEIVKNLKCKVYKRKFINYSDQRNYAIKMCNKSYKWQLHIDSDEVLSEQLIKNINDVLKRDIRNKSYIIKRHVYFMNRKLLFGATSNWHLRLFPSKSTVCENKKYDQHFVSNLVSEKINGSLLDINTKNLTDWITIHNKWSTLSSLEKYSKSSKLTKAKLFGNNIERTRFIKNIFFKLPIGLKSFFLFFVKYFLLLGFLDGRAGFIFIFLNTLWFHTLIDAKKFEIIINKNNK